MPEATDFFNRWSRRKADVRAGVAVVPEEVAPAPAAVDVQPVAEPPALPPPPSMEDAQQLTKDSDFKPFMQQNVGVDVKNAALKKLFADPHFNVMDRMDTYIDDYSIADPIPPEMLRRMVGTQLLKIFDDEPEAKDKPEQIAGPADESPVAAVAQSAEHVQPQLAADEIETPNPHDNTADLQLQPNHAAEPSGARIVVEPGLDDLQRPVSPPSSGLPAGH